MKFMKRVAIGATAFAGIATMGVTAVQAASTGTKETRMSGLVSAIATKFNLNAADVQQVFDAQHAAQETAMRAKQAEEVKARIGAAVTAGKLTQAQADAITAKLPEIQTFMDSLKGKTNEERETAIKAQMESVKAWATANNIPQEYLELGRGFMGGRGPGGKGGMMGPAAGLTQAVTAGKLTQAQADLIVAKRAELKAAHEANEDQALTKAQRETAMKAEREALKAWATANNIPEQYLLGGEGRGGHGGPGMMGGMGGMHGGRGFGRGGTK